MAAKVLKPVTPQPGRPLYLAARDAVREAIDAGIFQPGEQMPSTKQLSEQLSVSLVTAHRALQELVSSGVLQRSQGRGTFVQARYFERRRTPVDTRIGLVFQGELTLADFYHSQVLEGVRQAAHQLAIDLIVLRFGEDIRNECNGYLYINPLIEEIEAMAAEARRRQPVVAVGVRHESKRISSIDVDNIDLARQAVQHLHGLGHRRIAYVGANDHFSNGRDRWSGFVAACGELGIQHRAEDVVRAQAWHLDEKERMALMRVLSADDRATAIFAAGYHFALDAYGVAASAGLRVPEDVSIVGVDDPPSAAHLSPALTTLRQPLIQLGHSAVTTLYEQIQSASHDAVGRTLWAELIVRRSTQTPAGA